MKRMARKKPPPFDEKDKIRILLWSERHCCLCEKPCDTNIVIHHIKQKGSDEELSHIDNAIPLCFDCHGKIKSYDLEHRVGTLYKIEEIKARRNQIYAKYTRHLVPIVTFSIDQGISTQPERSTFPRVITYVIHRSSSLPVKARVEVKHILGGKDLGVMKDESGYYSGETIWHLNPAITFNGEFIIPKECQDSKDDLKIEARLTIIDEYGKPHRMLPQAWTYSRKGRFWKMEPRSFTVWT
jgi:hypothetical protein